MAEWRHVDRNARDPERPWLLCVEPPDPASPCGLMGCGRPEGDTCHMRSRRITWTHRHVPTRCTCGHSIERVPPEGR